MKKTCYDFLLENEYFSEEELDLVTKAFGDNEKTYDAICQGRYGMDVDQVVYYHNGENNENIWLSDYNSSLLKEDK